MAISIEAQKILSVLLMFAWPVLAGFATLIVWSFLIRGGYTSGENLASASAIDGICSVLAMFFFANVEGSDIADVMKANRAWGGLVGILFLTAIGGIIYIIARRSRRSANVESFGTMGSDPHSGELVPNNFTVLCATWIIVAIGALVWLYRIAKE